LRIFLKERWGGQLIESKVGSVKRKAAAYKVEEQKDGSVFTFFCDLSGAIFWKSRPIKAETVDVAYEIAWNEAKKHINACQKCGCNVIDALYNVDTLQCVKCSPWHKSPVYCPDCGEKFMGSDSFCRNCGKKISEEGVDDDADCQQK
jgi:hypothetical protein